MKKYNKANLEEKIDNNDKDKRKGTKEAVEDLKNNKRH